MKRKKNKPNRPKAKQTQPQTPATELPNEPVSRRSVLSRLRNYSVALAAVGGGGWYMVKDVQATMREHDLSRIGNGIPSIVQIHDPNCPSCTALQRNSRDALCEISDDKLQFLVANITTIEGRKLAAKHGVPHITLLFFDGDGKRRSTLSGVHESEQLAPIFEHHLAAYGAT